MTSTHYVQSPVAADSTLPPKPIASAIDDNLSTDSSFSDVYKDNADEVDGHKNEAVNQNTASVDYASSFEPDVEVHSDSQAVTQANIEKETKLSSVITANKLPSPSASSGSHASESDTSKPTAAELPPFLPTSGFSQTPQIIQTPVETTRAHTYQEIADGGVDIQALLDNITANAEKNEAAASLKTPDSATPTNSSFPMGLPAHSSLPPRPDIPRIGFRNDHSNYQPPGVPNHSYMPPPGVHVPLTVAGAPGTSTDRRGGLPPPPTASFRPLDASASTPSASDNEKWSPEINRQYDRFIIEEQGYVKSGQWSQFPPGSRMFIGNLASDKVTKRDIYHIFYPYGRIAQIAIKQAFAFVQFHDARVCQTAVTSEQGTDIRGKAIQLEVSKPAKNSKNASSRTTRRRSPDTYNPGRQSVSDRRYSGRQDEYGRDLPGTNSYIDRREVSPIRHDFRRREDQDYSFGDRNFVGRDSYSGRERERSRSPYNHRDSGRYRNRSPSPRRASHYAEPPAPPLNQAPQRDPSNVPDVEIIIMEPLDGDFVSWVTSELNTGGLKTEVMYLNREPLESVIQKQIIDGVHAVSKLNLRSQNLSQIPLQVFKRQPGSADVQFDEYEDLVPSVAAGVVLNVKTIQSQQSQQMYGQPAYQQPPQYPPQQQRQHYTPQPQYQQQQTPVSVPVPDLANAIGQMDNATLQKLLGQISSPPQQNSMTIAANTSIDLAAILGQLAPKQPAPVSQPVQQQYQAPPANSYGNSYANIPPAQAQAGQVQNILAQLARFRQQ